MKKALIFSAAFFASSLTAFAGNCSNWVRINNIASIMVEGEVITVNPAALQSGNLISPPLSVITKFQILPSAANVIRNKYWYAMLLSAQANSQQLTAQVTQVSTYLYTIDKLSIGNEVLNTECVNYSYPPKTY